MSARQARAVAERQEAERERQRDFEERQRLTQQAFNAEGDMRRSWMRDVLDVDDLEEKLQPATVKKVRGLLNKQWLLANLNDGQAHDRWYELEVMNLKVLGQHPPPESSIVGPMRAFLFDDESEGLWALTSQERTAIRQIVMSVQNMSTRSRNQSERRLITTSIARTERESDGQREKGSRFRLGLFS